MKHKTSELEGALLDAAVAIAEGYRDCDRWWDMPGRGMVPKYEFEPSHEWTQGGPIIERERISIEWDAKACAYCDGGMSQSGKTALIAAMRAYVESKLGDEVELPEPRG
jgi:hypothetical protein